MADASKKRIKVTAMLRPEIAEKLRVRAERNDRDLGYEIAVIVAERIKADEALVGAAPTSA